MSSLFSSYRFFTDSKTQLIKQLEQLIKSKDGQGCTTIFTPNPEQIVQAQHDLEFKQALAQGDILLADGVGLIWALRRLKKQPQPERITGVEVVEALFALQQKLGFKVLIVGGRDYQQSVNKLNQQNLSWTPGYEQVASPTSKEEKKIKDLVAEFKPDVVFVAFGAPYQEKWIIDHQELLNQNQVKLAMAVGGAFDFIFGKVKRAPAWMRKLGLEWLYRLVQQPWRWKRQLRLFEFVYLVLFS